MSAQDQQAFISWFQSHGGFIDVNAMGISQFSPEEGGRGAIALKDLPEGHVLFTIPRSLTLSTRTSSLPPLFGLEDWKSRKLTEGWVGLILCMMWEEATGNASKWASYFAILPTTFDTPMFWGETDLSELRGTTVVGKLGREEAHRDYLETLLPAIQSRPDLFPPSLIPTFYSLERYHIAGSRILSRSFMVEKWEGDEEDQVNEEPRGSGTEGESTEVSPNLMQVDDAHEQGHNSEEVEGEKEDEDEDEGEDSSDVAMVPMADMLNARYGCENSKLYHDQNELRMITTKAIRSGDQIWNTYGDLPNAELLRRYGHVDLLAFPQGAVGNPGDVVEVRADLLLAVRRNLNSGVSDPNALTERIEWWLEEGGDDTFVIEMDAQLPEAFISFSRLVDLAPEEWRLLKEKGKPPKPKVDSVVLNLAMEVLKERQNSYPTSIEEDQRRLAGAPLSLNTQRAIIVRLGEKRILRDCAEKLRQLAGAGSKPKRKQNPDPDDALDSKSKRSRR